MTAYDNYLAGNLMNYSLSDDEIASNLASSPIPGE